MNAQSALFVFLATGAVALFSFLSIAHWVMVRADERKDLERFALLRKLADQPGDSARFVLEFLRDEAARVKQTQEKKEHQMRMNDLKSGLIWFGVGVGVAIMLASITTASGLWTVGLIPMLVGAVIFGFAFVRKPLANRPA